MTFIHKNNIGVSQIEKTNFIAFKSFPKKARLIKIKLKTNELMEKKEYIPLLCGPMIETTAYDSPHSPNLTSVMNLSIPVTLNAPSPSISWVEQLPSLFSVYH